MHLDWTLFYVGEGEVSRDQAVRVSRTPCAGFSQYFSDESHFSDSNHELGRPRFGHARLGLPSGQATTLLIAGVGLLLLVPMARRGNHAEPTRYLA